MKELPVNVVLYKKTARFTDENVPPALLSTHYTKKSSWAKIVVLSGSIRYLIEGENKEIIELSPLKYGVIEPQIAHHLELSGGVEFYIEFYK